MSTRLDLSALDRQADRQRLALRDGACVRQCVVHLVVVTRGGVVEQYELTDARLDGQFDRLVDGAVAVLVGTLRFVVKELGVVHQDVDTADQVDRCVASGLGCGDMVGQVFALFVLTVAAAEAAIGLAILVVFFRNRGSIAVEDVNMMKG